MSLTSYTASKALAEHEMLKNIRLPSIFMKTFSIDYNNQAKCKTCNFSFKLTANDIVFHVTVCSGMLQVEEIQTELQFNCLVCNFETTNLHEWKLHLFKLKHLEKKFFSCKTAYSYDCESCTTFFYGFKNQIFQHQCKPKGLSALSKLMAIIYESFDVQLKRMLYCCTQCSHYSYNKIDVHANKLCKSIKNTVTLVCNTCLVTFNGISEKEFLNHRVSFEHQVLYCLNSNRIVPEITKSILPKLPLCITNNFVESQLLHKVRCIVCGEINISSYDFVYHHVLKCISSKNISTLNDIIPIKRICCKVCNYQCSSSEENMLGKDMYKCWVNHVISIEHLSKTKIQNVKINDDSYSLYSYYCFVTDTIFYGTDSFVKMLILKTNDKIDYLLYKSLVMAKIYRYSNTKLNHSILNYCTICQNDLYFKCEHYANIDPSKLFYCSTCSVNFFDEFDYNKHFVTSEHIILKYFKPDATNEWKLVEHLIQKMKINKNPLIERSPDEIKNDSICFSLSNECSSDEECDALLKSCDLELEKLPTKVCFYTADQEIVESASRKSIPTEYLLTMIDELSALSKKSALNNHLIMSFELLNQMPLAIHVIVDSKLFFCNICDLIYCNECSWIQHRMAHHSEIDNLVVFYCVVCHMYQIDTSLKMDVHIKSVEHKIMLKLYDYMKENLINQTKNKNVDFTLNHKNEVFTTKSENVPRNQILKTPKSNKSVFIEISDIKSNLRKDNYCELKKLIQENYGNFKQIANKKKSFMILLKNIKNVETLVKNQKKIENQYGFKIQVIGNHGEMLLSPKSLYFLSNWCALCTQIFSLLKIMEDNSSIRTKIYELRDSVCKLKIESKSIDIHTFGSQVYGLATKNSDVDLYLDINKTFNGEISNDSSKQVDLVNIFAEQCLLNIKEFKNVEKICDAYVPIVKFYHIPTKLNCDVSFKSGLSVYNSKLVKLYLEMDKTVKWLVCAIVKLWALQNNLKSNDLFTTYALIWLVLFYLMTESVVPPLVNLKVPVGKKSPPIIEGWYCLFGEWPVKIKIQNRFKLFLGFFQYYADKEKFKSNVLCPLIGKCMSKKKFFKKFSQLPEINENQSTMFKTYKPKIKLDFEKNEGMVLQDPFELSFNLTKRITKKKLTHFCNLCDETISVLTDTEGSILVEQD